MRNTLEKEKKMEKRGKTHKAQWENKRQRRE